MSSLLEKLKNLPKQDSDEQRKNKLKNLIKETTNQTFYQIMGIDPKKTIDIDQLKKVYRGLALILHPDKNKEKCYADESEELFKLINNAYGTLSDSDKEKEYRRNIQILNQKTNTATSVPAYPSYATNSSIYTKNLDELLAEFFTAFSKPGFSSLHNPGFVFFSTSGFDAFSMPAFSGSFTSKRARSSSRQSLRITIFEEFMGLLDTDLFIAHQLFRSQPEQVINLCQTPEQFMYLHKKDRELAYNIYSVQPDKVINLFQSYGQYKTLLKEDPTLARCVLRRQPSKIINLIKSKVQLEQLKSMSLELASDIARIAPDLQTKLSTDSNNRAYQSKPSYRPPQASSARFFNQPEPSQRNYEPQPSQPTSSYWNLLSKINSMATVSAAIFFGTLGAISILCLKAKRSNPDNIRSARI